MNYPSPTAPHHPPPHHILELKLQEMNCDMSLSSVALDIKAITADMLLNVLLLIKIWLSLIRCSYCYLSQIDL